MAADLASTTVAGATFATGATSALAVAARATTTFILPPARGDGVALRLWAGLSSRAAGHCAGSALPPADVGCLWFSRARPVCRCCTAAQASYISLTAGPQ